ncbi:hypothetical protein ACPVTF_04925 [Geobacillus icigianus]|uniref:hypothetical protein n=1 Tax=Geobacillus icigianus TaxID=1430331 RepID=UPI000A8D924D
MTFSAYPFVAWHGKLVIFHPQWKGTNRCLDGNECCPSWCVGLAFAPCLEGLVKNG